MNKEEFIKELSNLGITPTTHQLEQLETYYQLLITTNQKYNLTSITDKEDVYLKHFYDSLTIIKATPLNNEHICDIGTGAGFPGLVLKIMYPNINLTMIESTGKKCQFLHQVVDTLNLANVTIKNVRAEEYSKTNREEFDIVTCRAVAPLKHLLEYAIPMVKVKGYFIPLKGNVQEELINIDNYLAKLNLTLNKEYHFKLPKEQSNRTIIVFQKQAPTPIIYPRRYSEIKKKEI